MAKAEYKSAIRSRRLIRQAMVDLLHEKPLDKITVTDVVKRADINRGTFYAHYTDIPDLMDNLVENVCQALQNIICGRPEYPIEILSQLQAAVENDLEFYRKILTANISTVIIERLRNIFLDYMIEHESDFNVPNHEDYVFRILFGSNAVIMLYRDWFTGQLPYTLTELTNKASAVILRIIDDFPSDSEVL